ncbi:MAG: NUDIX domain-containing protein [Actinomycetales bacterium]
MTADDTLGPLQDRIEPRPVGTTEHLLSGMVWDVVRDTVDLGDAGVVRREYLKHPGAVGILALDDQERVAVVDQYRHPVGMVLWEIPAGLLDVAEEPPVECARRELAEEADLVAQEWHVLADFMNSPGGTSEAFRCFLARGLSDVPEAQRHARHGEELAMQVRWAGLDELRDGILAGRLHSPSLVVGVLAACAARDQGWRTLRPASAPWPQHPSYR